MLVPFCQVRELFKENLFFSKDPMDRLTLIDSTLPKAMKADAILRSMRREKREATPSEQALIDEVEAAREIIIQVSRQAPGGGALSSVPGKTFGARGVDDWNPPGHTFSVILDAMLSDPRHSPSRLTTM